MVKYGEGFFTSLGFDSAAADVLGALAVPQAAPTATWCATPAPGISTTVDDVRLKMCIQITGEDFLTIHHELGHNFYQRAYDQQPYLLPRQRQRWIPRSHRRYHRALGDAGLPGEDSACSTRRPDPSKDIGLLLHKALEKIAFLPFGLVIDQWRWKVFSGEIPPDEIQPDVVGACAGSIRASRRRWSRSEGGFRSRRQISRRRQRPVHALFPGRHSAVPVSPRAGAGGRLHRAAEPLLHLRQ